MNINATLIAQVVHFFIAYALLSRFFLRPLVALVFEENAYRAQLQQALDSEAALCIHKQELQKQQWITFQQQWQKRIPSLSAYIQHEVPIELHVPQPTPERVQDEVQHVISLIKERVDDAL